jgi:hypothetical protein
LDNCSAADFSYAKKELDHSLKLGNQYMNEVENKRLAIQKETLESLELKVEALQLSEDHTDAEVNAIEALDQKIDKSFIKQYPNLHTQYQDISKKLMKYFAPAEKEETVIKQYNLEAIESIKSAYSTFQSNERNYKQGINFQVLTEKLGGWESQYLDPSTQIYFQSVYSEIFSKLNPDVKPKFARGMLKEVKKDIG